MKAIFLFAIAAVTAAQAEIPAGRFMQDAGSGYRDVQISDDGKSAIWLTKDCLRCRETKSTPEQVKDLDNGWIEVGKTQFQVLSSTALFHPSMGDFSSAIERD
ncbi:hypothetical protein [Delftia tsuruhatensis]|uniref:hypothetical protein n=1 Tax=Delftia tsuruhatensis TaxID=180282 RepID=UPI002027A1C5|nr:hypothetical protein [Delftia tsuruhatensis]